MRPTIKKIAEIAGVTCATVSLVLNDKPGPSPMMKEKIKQIAKEIGYVPNINARNLVKGDNNTLGVFLLHFPESKEERRYYYYMEFLQDIMIDARKRGYPLLFFTDEDNTKNKISYAEFCREYNLKTAIFLGMNKEDKNMEELKNLRTTQVILFDIEETKNCNTIISDSYQGIKEMFIHLHLNNKKRLAVISGSLDAEIATKKKIKEINHFSKKFNITTNYYQGNFFKESGYEIGKTINYKEYDSIFAMNDAMAVGIIEAFLERNVNISNELEIIGFDNLGVTELLNPKLSSIAHDNVKIIEAIFKIIKNEKQMQQILIPTKFIKK